MDSTTAERPEREGSQSFHEIPEVSLCPPDSPDMGDLRRTPSPSSSSPTFQLYHQVPQGCPQDSPHLKQCHCCRQRQPIADSPCPDPITASPHPDCSLGPGKSAHSCSTPHMPSCHDTTLITPYTPARPFRSTSSGKLTVPSLRAPGSRSSRYSQLIVEFPMAVLVTCALILLGCSLAGILIGPLPDFSDPLSGFEPRGTHIGSRLSAWTKLRRNMGPGKALSPSPLELTVRAAGSYGDGNTRDISGSHLTPRLRHRRMLDWDLVQDTFFCDSPGERYAQLVFRSGNSASLWSLKAIHAICEMEQARIRSHAHFQDLCKQGQLETGGATARRECCPSWSLGNYLAVLSNATSCLGLTAQQVSDSLSLLRQCAPYYHDGSLAPSCSERGKLGHCASVPPQCKYSSAIYQVLHYLVDKDFLGPQTIGYKVPSLKYSLLFLPVEKGDPMMEIYLDNLEGRDLTYKNTTITGMDLGIKQKLFKYYLVRDSVYPVLAVVIMCLTAALYLRSFFLSVVSFVAIMGSLLTAYFFYKVAFQLTFFPSLNFAAVLVLLGSCSNQAFAFIDLWGLQLSQKPPASLEKRVNRVLQEVGYLILASGLTSSATFYSGYMSSITAIRCFAVYLGTASLISTLLALVWLPCSLILRERYTVSAVATAPAGKPCCALSPGGFWETSSRKRCLFMMAQKLKGLKRALSDTSDLLFIKILPCGVVKFRYIWICWFAVLAAGGTYITCVDPGMKLPALYSKATQLFRSSHPFERYDAEYRHQFMFERQKSGEDKPMTITLVWGVLPMDNGDHLNPKSNGSLMLDPHFNMSRPDAQVWLRELCGKIQNQSFYSPSSSPKDEMLSDNISGLLVLLEWQLTGLEALFISAAAGLSVDFTADYCISYSLAPHSDRLGRVAHSLKRMGSAGPGFSNSAANGAFGCGRRSRLRRSFGKGGGAGGPLCPGQQRHRQRPGRGRREPEQYELQPLACQLNDSFENSTCTSKLSNRPSVLSDDIQFRSLSPRRDLEGISIEDAGKESSCRHHNSCNPPPALQTSSPYKENSLQPVVDPPGDLTRERLLCRRCRSQSGGIKHWNISLSSSSSMEDIIISSQPLDARYQHSLSIEGATSSPFRRQRHRRLLSSQSQSSFDGLEDSNETCLSDIEPGPSVPQASNKAEGEPQPGHLNGKRDTLHLSLRETVFEVAYSGNHAWSICTAIATVVGEIQEVQALLGAVLLDQCLEELLVAHTRQAPLGSGGPGSGVCGRWSSRLDTSRVRANSSTPEVKRSSLWTVCNPVKPRSFPRMKITVLWRNRPHGCTGSEAGLSTTTTSPLSSRIFRGRAVTGGS
ncbi:hypothetical protein AAFF_G00411930 [Aldrovandia affinis]|uniref:SSD domain-containing protein n=1 Tax=Aldrovandia affinis TaxID=143900 RepID=A0AAD7SBC6_9TELE|nr:hypothetical protein AAFF_G00411930 [Aldrovandia affinis]